MKASHKYPAPKRVFSLLLCLVMACSLLPGAVLAEAVPCADGAHTWNAGEVTVAATCADPGAMTYTCTECGAVEYAVIPATGHTWGEWTTTAPTCTEDGSRTRTCSVDGCGALETETIPATGHSWDLEDTTPATCTESGTNLYKCSVCTETKSETVPATGHDWGDWVDIPVTPDPSNPQCPVHAHYCRNCNASEAETVHYWSDWTVVTPATCSNSGTQKRVCSYCGETQTQTIAPLEHTWTPWETVTAATCTDAGVQTRSCSACGESDTQSIEPMGHVWGEWTVTQAATCTAEGTRVHSCSVCGGTETEVIPANGHIWGDWTVTTVATSCIAEGAGVQTHTCSKCGDTETTTYYTAHTWGDWDILSAATCTAEGLRKHTCTVVGCGAEETDIIPAAGHVWGDWVTTSAATYEADGTKTRTCSVCQETETEIIPALTHNWGEWTITTAPTCTEDGVVTRTCTDDGCNAAETSAIPSLGHCFENGGTVCSRCGETIPDADVCPNSSTRKHQMFREWSKSYDGCAGLNTAYDWYECVICHVHEIRPVNNTQVPAHDFSTLAVSPDSYNSLPENQRSGLTPDSAVDDRGHVKTYSNYNSPCTSGYYVRYYCRYHDMCHAYEDTYVAPEGHNWEEFGRVEPSAAVDGYIVYKCTVCGEKKQEPIPALGTTYRLPEEVEKHWTDTWIRENLYTENQVGLIDLYGTKTNYGAAIFEKSNDYFSPDKIKIVSNECAYASNSTTTKALVALYGQEIRTGNGSSPGDTPYCDIVVEPTVSTYYNRCIELYLIDFGITNARGKPTKGIRNLTVKGDNVNVYLINSNLGFIDYTSPSQFWGGFPIFYNNGIDTKITVEGNNSHVYMGAECNARRPRDAEAGVTVTTHDPEDTYYDPVDKVYRKNGSHYTAAKPEQMRSSVDLYNLNVRYLVSAPLPNSTYYITGSELTGLATVNLNHCSLDYKWWRDGAHIDVNGFASLTLNDTWYYDEDNRQYSFPEVILNDVAALTLEGNAYCPITVKGYNTIRLQDASLTNHLTVSDTRSSTLWKYIPPLDYANDTEDNLTGGKLQLLLSGDSQILANESYSTAPAVMVASTGRLYIQDDPNTAGTGALTVKPSRYSAQETHAAIGGGADGLPHGSVYVMSGNITAEAYMGSAAIGGSNAFSKFSRDGGEFTLAGGVVNATADSGGAAIGGAQGGNATEIYLVGGTVNASVTGYGTYGTFAAAIGGGAMDWGEAKRTIIGYTEEYGPGTDMSTLTPVYADLYSYDPAMGGGGGHIFITGGCVVNAEAPNPGYMQYNQTMSGIDLYKRMDLIDRYYDKDGAEYSGTYYAYTDRLNTYSTETSRSNGRTPGYVLGSATEAANVYFENRIEVLKMGGVDGNPVLILKQSDLESNDWNNYAPLENHFYRLPNRKGTFTLDPRGQLLPNGYYDFSPSIVAYCVRMLVGKWNGEPDYTVVTEMLQGYSYRLRGQLNMPDVDCILDLPEGTALHFLEGAVLNVPSGFTINAQKEEQFVVDQGAVIQGSGFWPGKPVTPDNAPSLDQVRSLLDLMDAIAITQASGVPGEAASTPGATHLGVLKADGGKLLLQSGNSAESILTMANNAHATVLLVFSAGKDGFICTAKDGYSSTWQLYNWDDTSSVSLGELGALTATPANYAGADHPFGITLTDDGAGKVSVKLQNAKLSTPAYTVYSPGNYKNGSTDVSEISLNLLSSGTLLYTINLNDKQVDNNYALFSVPSFMGSEFKMNKISAVAGKCAVRYGGSMKFITPIADFAGVDIKELQLTYGNSVSLSGINGGGHVTVPEIAGFPVSGGAELYLNTFAPHRELTLNVSLQTPIFEGSFNGSLKEARGTFVVDTLYAEIAVGEGGIPLVPPTIVGYLMGGGLGFRGLADTVNMDSVGVPPVRLEIAAKGSIEDVINGWVRLSLGPSGFDLTMTGLKIKSYEFIKKLGMSASWDFGKLNLKFGRESKDYWGTKANMSMYITLGFPVPGSEKQLLLSATGEVGIGAFAGGYKEGKGGGFALQKNMYGKLKGSAQIPKKIVLGFFPFENLSLGEVEVGFYGAATVHGELTEDQTKNLTSTLKNLAKNTKLTTDATVGAKFVLGGGKFPAFYIKAIYVLGDSGITLDGGWGKGGSLFSDGEEPESIPSLMEVRANTVASLDLTGSGEEEEASLMGVGQLELTPNGDGTFTAGVSNSAANKVFLAMYVDGATEANLIPGNILITKDGSSSVTLVPLAGYNEDGNMVDAQGNTDTVNFIADPEEGTVFFAPGEGGTYTFALAANSGLTYTGAKAIELLPFVSLVKEDTTVSSTQTAFALEETETGKKYKVQVVLGAEKGASDYVLGEYGETTDPTTGEVTYDLVGDGGNLSGSITYSLENRTDIPTGAYYPSVQLLEYITAMDESGNQVSSWNLADQISLDTTLRHTNSTIPAAPSSVNVTASGNESMTASWSAVENADGYRIALYEKVTDYDMDPVTGEPINDTPTGSHLQETGLYFQTNETKDDQGVVIAAPATSIVMDLSSLDKGKEYAVGVKAVRYEGDTDNMLTGGEVRSAAFSVVKARPPVITFDKSVTQVEGGDRTFVVGTYGGSFTVTAEKALSFTVKNTSDGSDFMDPVTSDTLTVYIPGGGSAPLSLQIQATDGSTGDYALEYVTVNYDTVAPPLVLDELGCFPKWGTEHGYVVNVTGHSEAGASIVIWSDYTAVTSAFAGEDGSFYIPLQFTVTGDSMPEFSVEAVDSAGNRSAAFAVTFPANPVTVNFDSNSENASCSVRSIEISSGSSIGVMPTPYYNGTRLFKYWYQLVDGVMMPVSGSTVFTEDTVLYARWEEAVILTYVPGEGAFCSDTEVPISANSKLDELPVPQRTDGRKVMFLGWFTAESGGDRITADMQFNTNTTLYAHWCDYVDVIFSPGMGDCPVGALQVPTGDKIAEYPVPTATGYTFKNWYWSETVEGEEVRHPATGVTRYSEDTILYAEWVRITKSLSVEQADGTAGTELSDPTVAWTEAEQTFVQDEDRTEAWKSEASVTYARRVGSSEYGTPTTVKPTAPGQYKVTVQRDTFMATYIGSAIFTINPQDSVSYSVAIGEDITNGTVTADLQTVQAGTLVTVTAAANTGYVLTSLTYTPQGGSAQAIEANAEGEYTFLMPARDVTVDAVFAPRAQVNVYPVTDNGQGGQAAGHISITPEDSLYAGDEVTLNAPLEAGYEFLGWYRNEVLVCADRKYTFVIAEDTDLVAKYRIYGTAHLAIDGGSSFTINGSEKSTKITEDYYLGTTITVVSNSEDFAYWENRYGKVLSTSPSFTFTVTGDQEITAVFDRSLNEQATLVFESLYGQIMARVQLSAPDAFIVPSVPVKNGYDPQGWDYNTDGVYDETQDTLEAAIALGLGKVLTIHPLYTLKPMRYTVSVTDGSGSGTYNQNDLVTVTADAAPEGYKFSHWENSEGTILSYSESYTFFADQNIALTAMFVVDTATVEAVGTTAIISTYTDTENKKLTFVSMSTVPEGCSIDLAGILATDSEAIATGTFDETSDGVRVRGDAWTGTAYRYTWTKANVTAGTTWYVRAYLVYTDANGNQRKVYGDVTSLTMPDSNS